eukprot:TRINITY_DN15092_c0_g1_i1.p1 TRINITY_DN15092_c0_g1~~TRINITY_DN15092_c0_g1_i1.p1  ORF type:complete len:246 (+),score=48.18 TRINITY_DN15092_c0_g1_i1:175-912(+)
MHNMGEIRLPKENDKGQYDPSAKLAMLKRYKFNLIIANTLCEDYVAEKVEDAFLAGAVPVVLESSRMSDYEPSSNSRSMIHINDFPNPKALASFLLQLAGDEDEYRRYLEFRTQALSDGIRIPSAAPKHTMECFLCQAAKRAREELSYNSQAHAMKCYGDWRNVMTQVWSGAHQFGPALLENLHPTLRCMHVKTPPASVTSAAASGAALLDAESYSTMEFEFNLGCYQQVYQASKIQSDYGRFFL